jgi:hypothetical protein
MVSGFSTSSSGMPNNTPSSENMPTMKACSWWCLSSPSALDSSSIERATATRDSSMAERGSPSRDENSIRFSQRQQLRATEESGWLAKNW